MYYYLLNQQGDVEALMDASGSIVATYEYDPWGAVTVKNANGALDNDDTSIGNMNPLRYRGYYYDNETGFYYLESRYYDPVVGRFISADTFASTDATDVLSANMFAYCNNDPVNYVDDGGNNPVLAAQLATGAVCGVVNACFTAASLAIDAKMSGKAIDGTSFAIAVGGSFASGFLSAFDKLKIIPRVISLGSSLVAGIAGLDSWEGFDEWAMADVFSSIISFTISIFVGAQFEKIDKLIGDLVACIASFNFSSLFSSLKAMAKSLAEVFKSPKKSTQTKRSQSNIREIHALGA